ncbi:sodium:calcium antiporter [Candidatus Woesearchaeota archaeon]|nr:sodium:calcium antiporter [Candidatus Woesearchaeota archaeon]
MLIVDILIFIAACSVLVKSSSWLLKSLIKISFFFNISDVITGSVIMAISTSFPELSVGIMSAFDHQPILGLGTSIGTIIFNLTMIMGIITLMARGIKMRNNLLRKELLYMLFIVFTPVILMNDHYFWQLLGIYIAPGISRWNGFILIAIFCLYLWKIFSQHKKFNTVHHHERSCNIMKETTILLFNLSLLLLSAKLSVEYAELLSGELGIANLYMGLFILAIGTSLPELVFSTRAVLTRHQDMALGDLIGSAITNSTLVIGAIAVISPIGENIKALFISSMFMLVICFIFFTFAESGRELSWKEGISLILLYCFYLFIQLYTRTNPLLFMQ